MGFALLLFFEHSAKLSLVVGAALFSVEIERRNLRENRTRDGDAFSFARIRHRRALNPIDRS